jgi:hypothetical protein
MSESLTREQIARVLAEATGAPSSGAVADILPALVDALDEALNPAPPAKDEKRVVKAEETR